MAKEILIIGGHDWSTWVESKGYGWSRNDLDTDQTKRTKDGILRRQKIGTKRKLTYKTRPMPRAEMAALDDSLSATFFEATYLDIHGVQTRTFYCSSFETSVTEARSDGELWAAASFHLIEQ